VYRRRRRQWPLFAAMAVLGAAAFPWYRQPGAVPDVWFGLPDWVVVAGLCFLGVACLNAAAWWRADWTDESRNDDWNDDSVPEESE
jgi:hypothetical protein